ncbi:hypothetical protein B0J15DRAFT_474042 [Fusarium solani]|jgi:hypothetical protein|uniref:Uncharacterized protein n=1 Tax=Fusarium solani TaxID=169388 RepID=A0A9P9L586_FUSSL|nr:uncharacterized protein B0J15DRAFT_474042 [Fusarium solani]KAH7275055.1 hypothetical protein B0J15DRAFT_474042 [Fusarium solani]
MQPHSIARLCLVCCCSCIYACMYCRFLSSAVTRTWSVTGRIAWDGESYARRTTRGRTTRMDTPRSVEAPWAWDEEAVRQLCLQENTSVPIGVINRNNSRHSSSNFKHQTQTNETWTQVRCCSTYLGVPASSEAIVPLRFQVALWYPPSIREPAQ